uniref:Cation/H+ exchanger domain-containing protein n=1 Tax=Acrobeloides nanus TaxID=290746 RepID=A0A914DAW0_9BILA
MSCTCMYGSAVVGLESLGPVAVLVLGFVAGMKWKKLDSKEKSIEAKTMQIIWEYFAQPLLFALIGLQLSFGEVTFFPSKKCQ